MRLNKRAEIIRQELESLYPNPPIPLDHKDTFTLLIAVLLSAQCTDKKVNEVTPGLFHLADTASKMIELGEDQIYKSIKHLGLARQKAKHIFKLSNLIVDKFGGEVPKTFKELELLPGVGHKTASVVLAQAFGVPTFPVDTHIHRLAQRWGLTNGSNVKQTERDLKRIFPIESWNKLHLQIIFYGREYCTARGCNGMRCALCRRLYPKRRFPVKVLKP
ncbi:endonuclease III [Prochlorococcus sp. MIT 1300]|uniref:endonuclease III n=1 Tax=Prochlorococcus sp. MIT 1300 TaxID=3096218 RepID=UPI002A747E6B|nr:endonuclease III [Prochlorococcus sp. MIT 1300]